MNGVGPCREPVWITPPLFVVWRAVRPTGPRLCHHRNPDARRRGCLGCRGTVPWIGRTVRMKSRVEKDSQGVGR